MTAADITITTEWRRYRIRGLERNTLPGVMKVNILIYNERTERFHVDNFDLYHARSRRTFTMEAADEIGASESQLRSDLGPVLLKLEQLQAEQKQLSKAVSKPRALSETERSEAMESIPSCSIVAWWWRSMRAVPKRRRFILSNASTRPFKAIYNNRQANRLSRVIAMRNACCVGCRSSIPTRLRYRSSVSRLDIVAIMENT